MSWQARVVAGYMRVVLRRARWGRDAASLARRARRLMGAPPMWGRLRSIGLVVSVHGAGTIPVARVAPPGARDADGVVLYLHGGGFVSCSPATHRPIIAALARATGLPVFAPDYRRAPEHRFPAALDDVAATYDWLLARGVPATRIALAGDSAGGGLVLSLLVRARARKLPRPAAAALFSPWADLTGEALSLHANDGRDALFRPANIREFAAAYLGDASPRLPEASPRFAELRDAPPLLIQVGAEELLLDDARGVAAAARAGGATVVLEEYPGTFHCWQMCDGLVPEATRALRDAGAFLRAAIPRAAG